MTSQVSSEQVIFFIHCAAISRRMASPLQKKVLTPKKSILIYRLEQKIASQEKRIQLLEDQLEESNIANKRLKSILIPNKSEEDPVHSSPQFKISL